MLPFSVPARGNATFLSITRKATLLLSAACLCFVATTTYAQNPISGKPVPSLSQLDAIMQTYMAQYSSPGASLAVTVNGRLVFARGYGYAKVDTGEFAQPDSLFRIASNSKPITAAGIYKLVEQGKLSLTTQPFATILAGLTPPSGTTVDPRYASITIQELLQHTAGFDDTIPPDPAFAYPVTAANAFGAPAPATPQLLIKYMLGQPLQHTPGTTFAYSNFGYIILGYVIEQVSGASYATYIQNNVFTVAGIVRTQPGASLLSGRLPGEVAYYDYPGAPLVSSVEQPVGASVPYPYGGYSCTLNLANGCWVSSTMDLLRFTDSINGQFPTPMFTTYPASNPFYSPQFYFAIPPNGPGWEYIFYGSLPGTNSLVHLFTGSNTTGKVTYSALFNTRDGSNISQPETDVDNAIKAYVTTVTAWPTGDLFPNYQGTASSCSFTLSPPNQSANANGGSQTVQLTDANFCAWSAISNDSWIHVTAGALNSDSGLVAYTVDPNQGAARTGTISIAGQTFTVTQASSLPIAATPVISPAAGTYSSAQQVTITDPTPGATIYYTTDGTIPTTSSTTYSGALNVSSTETITAIAAAAGYTLSATASSTYTITGSSTAGLQFVPVTPCRVADTRDATGSFGGPILAAGTTREFDISSSSCEIPGSAVAYSLNVTVVPGSTLNYLTMWPTGLPQPYVSTLNSDGRIKANAAITPAGTNGGVDVYVSDATHVIIDIDGYFVPAGTTSALAFYPVTPCRVSDTRNAAGPLGGPFIPGNSHRDFSVLSSSCGLPYTAQAYSLNVTAIPHTILNYLTAWSTGQGQPNVSTLNSSTGAIAANAAIIPASQGYVSIFVSDDADVILDVNGYFAPPSNTGLSLYTATPCRIIDTRNAAGAFNGVLSVAAHASACAPPAAAQAYVLNATVVPPGPLIYLTLWPNGQTQPYVSTLNAIDGAITSNMAIVPNVNGTVDVFSSDPTNAILDISSYFAP